jgi:hypothetical protein
MSKTKELFYGVLFLLLVTVSNAIEFIWMFARLPIRITYCTAKGHEWLWLGNGFFGMFAPKKNFKCIKCGFKTAHPENHKTIKSQQAD